MTTIHSDRVSLVLEFCGRAAFATLAFVYFYDMPDASGVLDLSLTVIGLACYVITQGALLGHRLFARPAFWQAPTAALLDFVAVLAVVVADPFPAPPSLLLVLVAALNAGMGRSWVAGAASLAAGTLVVAAALTLRGLSTDPAAAHGMAFLIAFMLACILYFALLTIRRSLLETSAAQYPEIDLETRLLNRRGFENAARYLVPLHHRTQLPVILMLASLDARDASRLDMRLLEKSVGAFSQAVRLRARRSDVIARLTEDEFVFMLFDTSPAGGEVLARSLLDHFTEWAGKEGGQPRLTVGMVTMPIEPVAIDQLIARARGVVQRAQKHPSSPGIVTAAPL